MPTERITPMHAQGMSTGRSRRRLPRSIGQRAVSVLLVFLIVSDIGYHIAAPFFVQPERYAGTSLVPARPAVQPEGGCPLPDGDGLSFHHHHYPAVISQTPPPVPLITLAVNLDAPAPEVPYAAVIDPTGRAPPSL